MPRPSKGARLYLRERAGKSAVWVIRDGEREVATGCAAGARKRAEEAPQNYVCTELEPASNSSRGGGAEAGRKVGRK